MTTLQSGALRARVRADHGFDITSITLHGHEILAVMPWEAGAVVPAADEATWTRAWTGGWQLAAPSSSNACVADGLRQGFHGNASQAPWTVTDSAGDHVSATWEDNVGLRLERTVALDGHRIQVRTTARNVGHATRHLIATEHLILGSELLANGITIEASGYVADIEPDGRAATSPATWPGNGWDRVDPAGPAARFSALSCSGAEIRLTSPHGLAVTVSWDSRVLPYAWLWQEIEATIDQPWAGRSRACGIEPSMTTDATGLASAIDDGTARRLQSGDALSWHVDVAVEAAARPLQQPDRPTNGHR